MFQPMIKYLEFHYVSDFYGYTPMVIIIKDGKAVNASVGALSESNFKKFLSSNGIK